MNKNNKGFTLAELLIVVAIIAVLVGISIPVFNGQLEKAKESKDLSNVRSAYAELMIAALVEDETETYSSTGEVMYKGNSTYSVSVPLSQTKLGWESSDLSVAGVSSSDSSHWIGLPSANGKCKIEYKADLDEVFFFWDNDGSAPEGNNQVPENSGPINTLEAQINAKKEVLSSSPPNEGETYSIEAGNVYEYNGKLYVALNNSEFNHWYYPIPGSNDAFWTYREINVSNPGTIKTTESLEPINEWHPNNFVLKDLYSGALYKAENGDLYVYKNSDGVDVPPPGQNWQLVNYR